MANNVGNLDRVVRLVIAVAIVAAYALGKISGTVAIVLGVVAAVMAFTALVRFCPLYKILGISSCPLR